MHVLPDTSPSAFVFDTSLVWIQIQHMLMDWHKETTVTQIIGRIGEVLEIVSYSWYSGTMRSNRVRIFFKLDDALVPSIWIPFCRNEVWMEVKYECSPQDQCIAFEVKHVLLGEWIRS